jgi:hypothetical protein
MPAYVSNWHAQSLRFIEPAHSDDEKVLVEQSSHENLPWCSRLLISANQLKARTLDVPGAGFYSYRRAMSSSHET